MPAPDAGVDLSSAVIVLADRWRGTPIEKAALWLQEHVLARSGLFWEICSTAPAGRFTVRMTADESLAPDTFACSLDKSNALLLDGGTPRSVLYAVGWLIRRLELDSGRVMLHGLTSDIRESPRFAIRGHQLGYRSLPNTYDAWDLAAFERYIRDLLIFGINSIELVPTLDPNEPASPLMPLPPWEMNRRLSSLLAEYDLDVWAWLPITDGDPAVPESRTRMLASRSALFASMERLDHLFVPGGDPGNLSPQALITFLADVAQALRTAHPRAGLWVSPQGFDKSEIAEFYRILRTSQPDWLTGIVHGPWVPDSLPCLREATPAQYRIHRYPDIGHCVRCQYPAPHWDRAFALTLGREPINPRPFAQAHIHNLFMDYAEGAITYSEGVNDDLNKAIWAARLWNPEMPVEDILADYARAFFRHENAPAVARAYAALERNWVGPINTNPEIGATLAAWRAIDGEADNWRYLQGLFRAIYDRYLQERTQIATTREADALALLESATDCMDVAARARAILSEPIDSPSTAAARKELLELGAQLWHNIGMQMSVSMYGADAPERGAVLDFLEVPLNDAPWLLAGIDRALELKGAEALRALASWTDPGPGGYYDDLGRDGHQPHLVQGDWSLDPGYLSSPQDEFSLDGGFEGRRLSWLNQASTLYNTPLRMRYSDLDPTAQYRLLVVYTGRFRAAMRLTAGRLAIHGPLRGPDLPERLEFRIPGEANAAGTLDLMWERVEGRGCQVAEVWLMREG